MLHAVKQPNYTLKHWFTVSKKPLLALNIELCTCFTLGYFLSCFTSFLPSCRLYPHLICAAPLMAQAGGNLPGCWVCSTIYRQRCRCWTDSNIDVSHHPEKNDAVGAQTLAAKQQGRRVKQEGYIKQLDTAESQSTERKKQLLVLPGWHESPLVIPNNHVSVVKHNEDRDELNLIGVRPDDPSTV